MQTLSEGIDIASTVILKNAESGWQGVLTSTTEFKTAPVFCRVEGTEGYIEVSGPAASVPTSFSIYRKHVASMKGDPSVNGNQEEEVEEYTAQKLGFGFYHEVDTVALDIAQGNLESATMLPAETMRVMRVLDEVRRPGGARFPQDDE